jgi:hypothetical protein
LGSASRVEVGITENVRSQPEIGIEALGLAVEDEARLAERIDGGDELRHRATLQVDEGLARFQDLKILLRASLRHEFRKLCGKLGRVADKLLRVNADSPGIDRPGERNSVAIDDVAARGKQGIAQRAYRAIGENLQPHQAKRDQQGDAGEHQHHQHQTMICQRERLTALGRALHAPGIDRHRGHWPPALPVF